MTFTLSSIDLGEVQKESHSLKAGPEEFPMPTSPSYDTTIIDFEGVTREISIDGKFVDTMANVMNNFVSAIEALMSGSQIGVTYHSDNMDQATTGWASHPDYRAGDVTVYIKSFRWDLSIPSTTTGTVVCDYTISMIEGL